MRLLTPSIFLVSYAFASESLSPPSTSENMLHSALSTLSTSSTQPQVPNLELKHRNLDRRQIQPAAVGAPAQVAAGAAQQPNAGAAAPAAANPVVPVVQTQSTAQLAATALTSTPQVVQTPANAPLAPTALTATPPVLATPAAAPAAPAGGGGIIGGIPIIEGPAIAVTSAPLPRSGSIGLGTLTGQIGVVKTDEAKSEAGLAAGKRFGFIASWPSAFKVGASLLLGTAVGVGILL
ncbi:MAG: hypothetical protein Q9192_001549 [Flavoplaca navasiana]